MLEIDRRCPRSLIRYILNGGFSQKSQPLNKGTGLDRRQRKLNPYRRIDDDHDHDRSTPTDTNKIR